MNPTTADMELYTMFVHKYLVFLMGSYVDDTISTGPE